MVLEGSLLLVILALAWFLSGKRTRFEELDVNQDGEVDAEDLDAARKDLKESARKIHQLNKRVK